MKIGMCVRMEVAEDLPRRFCDSSLFPGEIALKVPVFAQNLTPKQVFVTKVVARSDGF